MFLIASTGSPTLSMITKRLTCTMNLMRIQYYASLAERVKTLLCAVRTIQNRFSPINRIPVEILGTIFTFLMPPYKNLGPHETDANAIKYEWHKHSLVCRYWRQIIVSTPYLWSDILIPLRMGNADALSRFVSVQLLRSGGCPLNVLFLGAKSYLSPDSTKIPIATDLLANTHRIRHLRISISSDNENVPAWTRNATQLEVLELVCAAPAEQIRPSFDPPLLSHVNTPRLHTLVVRDYTRWQTGTFCTLRCLILTTVSLSILADVKGLLDVLASNAMTLEDLVILDNSERHAGQEQIATAKQTIGPETRISMSVLKRLVMKGSLFTRVIEPKLIMKGCARVYDFNITDLGTQRWQRCFTCMVWGMGYSFAHVHT
ncbi:hypothetical protein BDW22DRAFT_1075846 [Trametopsis cervina]|nr:hypothetical protein BDW22DRAFT_1075846 [Trametopsis cervina]